MTGSFSNRRLIELASRVMLLASLILAAFAHTAHPLQITTPNGFDERAYAAQYSLPDGTLPIICDRSGDGGTHHPTAMPCEFCSLADNSHLIAPFSATLVAMCGSGLENQLASKSIYLAKTLHGLHGASRAPPRI